MSQLLPSKFSPIGHFVGFQYGQQQVPHFADSAFHAVLPDSLCSVDDVCNHKQLLKIVSHTPIEVEHMGAVMEAGSWHYVTRKDIPEGLAYSWWSFRSSDWDTADKGRRLDHIWAAPDIINSAHCSRILGATRRREQTSYHVPVFATFDR